MHIEVPEFVLNVKGILFQHLPPPEKNHQNITPLLRMNFRVPAQS